MSSEEATHEELRRIVAATCEVVLHKRDPAMIFMLLARIAYKEARAGFSNDLERFRADLAEVAVNLENENADRAERLLQIALQSANEILEANRQQFMSETKSILEHAIKDYYSNHVGKSVQTLKKISFACLGGSIFVCLIALALVILR